MELDFRLTADCSKESRISVARSPLAIVTHMFLEERLRWAEGRLKHLICKKSQRRRGNKHFCLSLKRACKGVVEGMLSSGSAASQRYRFPVD